jgi:hypothetical protein
MWNYLIQIIIKSLFVAFDFGRNIENEIFSNPFESFYDLLALSLNAMEQVYEDMLLLQYQYLAQVGYLSSKLETALTKHFMLYDLF